MSDGQHENGKGERIYAFVCEYWRVNMRAPSLREIVDGAGISSTSIVTYHIDKLIDAGRLQRGQSQQARSLHPTGMTIHIPEGLPS